jgi:hypothetical protein
MAYNPYYTPYLQYPQYQAMQQPMPNYQNSAQTQNFSQPTIHAEIVQISGDRAEAESFPVQTGGTQMMINKTEDKIFIKTVYANNQMNLDVFVKEPPEAKEKKVNYDEFVTWDKLEQRLSQLNIQPIIKREDDINE